MPFTDEQRAKAKATRAANKAKRLASGGDKLAAALAEIDRLKAQLGISETKRSEAESDALALAQSQTTFQGGGTEEVPTGKTKMVRHFKEWKINGYKDNGDPIVTPIFKRVAEPTYFYKINMAPVGGMSLKINGEEFFHGHTVEVTLDELRTIKDMVYKTWKHDRDIHGSDESFYRGTHRDHDPRNKLSARGM